MAIGTRDDMIVYNAQFQTGLTETVAQQVDIFNAASNNSIILENDIHIGDLLQEAMYLLAGGFAQRDPSATGDVTPVPLTQGEIVSPKINWRDGPYEDTMDAFAKIGEDFDQMAFILGQQAGGKVAQSMVESATAALMGLIFDPASPFVDGRLDDGTNLISYNSLFQGMAKLGDRAAAGIVAWLMDSASYYKLAEGATQVEVTNVAGTAINTGSAPTLGRPAIVTDSAYLRVDAASVANDRSITYGLTQGAIRVKASEVTRLHLDEVGGKENLVMRYQSEGTYTITGKGGAFATATLNPTNAQLSTAANWSKVVTSHKDGPGVCIINKGAFVSP